MPNKSVDFNSSNDMSRPVFKGLVRKIQSKPRTVHQPHGCIELALKPNGRGHCQIKSGGIKYLAHRIMACHRHNPEEYTPYSKATALAASHLCGKRWCVNPQHLVLEHEAINQTRDCCRMFGDQPNYRCPHNPVCLGCIHIDA